MATPKALHSNLDVDLEALPIKSDPEQDTKPVKESSKDWITDVLTAVALMVALCEYINASVACSPLKGLLMVVSRRGAGPSTSAVRSYFPRQRSRSWSAYKF